MKQCELWEARASVESWAHTQTTSTTYAANFLAVAAMNLGVRHVPDADDSSPLLLQRDLLLVLRHFDVPAQTVTNHFGQSARRRGLTMNYVSHSRWLFEGTEPAKNFVLI